MGTPTPKLQYDCSKCAAYCCSYDEIDVGTREIARIAKHLGMDPLTVLDRYTKLTRNGKRVLRHQRDDIFGRVCTFLDRKTRRCTIYEARPGVCHEYPDKPRCGYYEFLMWERSHQADPQFIPLLKKG
ncbi:MAG TPA: YkgJ family cysteine cluster protein [Thermoanaerobaculia bacterium]|nr:YkgJ family cysteine cluster protein [Thermoanaerobaculia bacterium]